MGVDETIAAAGMMVTAINVADPGVGQLHIGDAHEDRIATA
jgi:hypothetical protein